MIAGIFVMTARAAATTARGTSISSAALPGGPDGVPSISRTPPLVCSPKPPPLVTGKHQRVLIVQLIHLQTIVFPPGDWDAICTCVANFALKPFRCLSSPTVTRPSAGTAGGWNWHTFTVRTLLRIKNACPRDLVGFAFKDEYKEYFDVITGKTTVEGLAVIGCFPGSLPLISHVQLHPACVMRREKYHVGRK
jgi:hypothetical protein